MTREMESEIEMIRRVMRETHYATPELKAEADRIFRLALRGALIPDDATDSMIEAGYANKDIGSPAIVYSGIWRDMLRTALREV